MNNKKIINCDTPLKDDINIILDEGWEKTTKKFAKEKETKRSFYKLKLLDGIRLYYVDKLFHCAVNHYDKFHKYYAFGSTNITSDYDLTITGKYSPEIMITMFEYFLVNLDNTSTHCFDTNLYCIGFYNPEGLNKNLSKYIVQTPKNENIISFQPKTKNQKTICLKYSLLKLLEANIIDKVNLSPNFIDEVKELNNKLKNNIENINPQWIQSKHSNNTPLQLINNKNKHSHINNNQKNEYTNLVKRYYEYYSVTHKLFEKYLYPTRNLDFSPIFPNNNPNNNPNKNLNNLNNNSSSEFMNLICQGLYNSIEAYYTPCTVNVVVLETQAGGDLKLNKFNYLISTIENLGDLNIHYNHLRHKNINLVKNNQVSSESSKILLKISKYIYRIYYSLSKLDDKFTKKTIDIKERVMTKRNKSENLTKNDLKYINNTQNIASMNNFIDNLTNKVLKEINTHLNNNSIFQNNL